ncbi:phytanoyl-CoA dioxygenase family protein [Tautonia plasticadhaerens]|uniref:Phytanoyl-CoA dioxygenase (PhyH) n=1 Tax=Tautonia plasticadhaerens TaxID=2527974 RepID=A0A518H5J0_9BACT|nr:phytanoyl-CoA dioxygenase family protein [Tautonia plasticadhaerens]QDV36107.1 Phytanoyl-CoA dioxygenase (PhyH) [Tautonia plasticadhaerens]
MPTVPDDLADRIDRDGFAVVPGVLDDAEVDALIAAVGRAEFEATRLADPASLRRGKSVYGLRDLLGRVPEVRILAASPEIRGLVEPVLGPGAFAVRGLWFDKTAGANWNLPWHRDLTVAARARVDAPGFSCWTAKAGIPHALAPPEVLDAMLTIRLHLDPAGPDNGPLRVLPGSHRLDGRDPGEVAPWRARVRPVECAVDRGGAVLMRPMLLHASNSARSPRHRRVVHLEFASAPLPGGVEWYDEVRPGHGPGL